MKAATMVRPPCAESVILVDAVVDFSDPFFSCEHSLRENSAREDVVPEILQGTVVVTPRRGRVLCRHRGQNLLHGPLTLMLCLGHG